MARRYPTISFDDFSAGKSTTSGIFANVSNPMDKHFGLKSAQDAVNVVMSENGLEKFAGYDNYLSAAIGGTPTITGLYEYKKTGTSSATAFIVTAGTKVYTASGGSLTEIYSGLTSGAYCSFITFSNVVIIMNGVDVPLQYDGTTCAAVTYTDPDGIFENTSNTTATPAWAGIFRNNLFYGGDPSYPDRLWKPRPGTHNNFDNSLSTVDAFDISPGDGGKLTGFKAVSKDLAAIYKEGAIFRLSGSSPFGSSVDPFNLEEVTRDVGCIAPRTIVQVARDHYFLSQDGLKKLSIVFDYGDIQQLDPTYEIKDAINELNYTASTIDDAFCVYVKDDRHLYLHVPGGGASTNTECYVHDVATGANMPRSGITASCGAIVSRLYYTGGYDGQIYKQLFGDNYDGSAINSSWESKWLALGNLQSKKDFKSLLIYFETSGTATITVQWQVMKLDGTVQTGSKSTAAIGTDTWDVGEWDSAVFDSGESTVFKEQNLGRGRAIKLKITNSNADERWKVRRVELEYRDLGKVSK